MIGRALIRGVLVLVAVILVVTILVVTIPAMMMPVMPVSWPVAATEGKKHDRQNARSNNFIHRALLLFFESSTVDEESPGCLSLSIQSAMSAWIEAYHENPQTRLVSTLDVSFVGEKKVGRWILVIRRYNPAMIVMPVFLKKPIGYSW